MSDDEKQGGEGQGPATPSQQPAAGGLPTSQEQLNAVLASNKKGLQRELAEAKTKLQQYEQLKGQVEELLGGRSFEEIAPLLEETTTGLKSAQEQLRIREEQHAKKIKEATERADRAENEYRTLRITRDIADAVADKASTPAARGHLIKMAAERAQISKDGQVLIEMEFEEEGVKVKKPVPPSKAIELMEGDVDNYGPFFKATATAGTGQANGGKLPRRLANGMPDLTDMPMDEYVKNRTAILGGQL